MADALLDLTPERCNVSAWRGSRWAFTITITDSNDDPVDLSTYELVAQIRDGKGDDADLIIDLGIDDAQAASGVLTVFVTDDATAEIADGSYWWAFRIDSDDNDEWDGIVLLYGNWIVGERVFTEVSS